MSYAIERKLIETRYKAAMPVNSPIQYGNIPLQPPATGFTRISIMAGGSGLMGIGDLVQRRHAGVVDVQIFVPVDKGEVEAREIADKVEAALAHQDLREGTTRVITFGSKYQRIGKSGDWFQVNVSAAFNREEYA